MVRYREGHAGRTKREIVDAASRLMRDRGYAEASVGVVMKAVGLTHGGFYAHFPDKTALLATAVEEAFVDSPRNFAFLADLARQTGDIGLIARHYLADQRVANVDTGCPAAALLSETPRQHDAVRVAFQSGVEATMRALATAPGMSKEEGGTSYAALSMLIGGLALMRAVPDPALAAAVRDQIIAGIRMLAAAAKEASPPDRMEP
jgi:AcrR family transcriptional regulator